jgi:hypothetical protein
VHVGHLIQEVLPQICLFLLGKVGSKHMNLAGNVYILVLYKQFQSNA